MKITRGIIQSPQKVLIYGPEGIGKSTFASRFPNPIFIDTEGSTKRIDVARLPAPTSWAMLLDDVRYVKSNPGCCGSLIIDTADWAEKLCAADVCAKSQKKGIEDFGYGKGYVYLSEEFGRLLNHLDELIALGINVVFTAHAQPRKFDQPDEMGSYDRWELKLEKKTAPMVKEWVDMVLFANYKTYVVKLDDGKSKAQGGTRTMYTTHHVCWDAKNRHGLPDEIPFDFASIAHCIPGTGSQISVVQQPTQASVQPASTPQPSVPNPVHQADQVQMTVADPTPPPEATKQTPQPAATVSFEGIPKALADLMEANSVTPEEIQAAVSTRGYYPVDTPISKYDPNFISGVLISAWPQVYNMILSIRDELANAGPF